MRKIRQSVGASAATPFWYQLDGEPLQLEVFKRQNILNLLRVQIFIVGKPPAITTEVTQACDAGDGFKAPKTVISTMDDKTVMEQGDLVKTVKDVMNDHHREYKTKIAPTHLKAGSIGVVKVLIALQSTITKSIITKSSVQGHPTNFVFERLIKHGF